VIFNMKNLILILFLPLGLLAQDSWVRFQVQFDFYAPTESNFFMVSDASGDTSMFYQPTIQYEYLDTIINVFSGDYTISLNDSYGDGWTSTNPASFRMGNACQGPILHWDPVVGSFFQRDSTVTILPCPPPGPPPVCVQTVVLINLDQYPEETSWDIKDSLGNVLLSGGVYSNVPDYQPQVIINCLPVGELSFTIYDLYGDGLEGSLWGGQDGSYYVIQCGDTLVYGDDPSFGQDSTHVFISDTCVPPPPVLGCMDDDYVEYDPSATVSDSSCATLKIYGCTDDTMFNYNASANNQCNGDNSCCVSVVLGCIDPTASNYSSAANTDNGQCQYSGCMNSGGVNSTCLDALGNSNFYMALNFDPNATIDDGSCECPIVGCTVGSAINYDPNATAPCGDNTANGGNDYPLTVDYTNQYGFFYGANVF